MRIFAENSNEEEKKMARPIAETPILFGEDAERFLYEMEHVEPLPEEIQESSRLAYEWLKSIATFTL